MNTRGSHIKAYLLSALCHALVRADSSRLLCQRYPQKSSGEPAVEDGRERVAKSRCHP